MKEVRTIAYRFLTNADFFNIYKRKGAEIGGGGQKYIDFPTASIPADKWVSLFRNVPAVTVSKRAHGPCWEVPIRSIGITGLEEIQRVTIYQRRAASISIASQGLETRQSNRILAWHPAYGFPEPGDREKRHQLPPGLAVYLVRTADNEIWAGWFQSAPGGFLPATSEGSTIVGEMTRTRTEGDCGLIELAPGSLLLDESRMRTPLIGVATVGKPLAPKRTVSAADTAARGRIANRAQEGREPRPTFKGKVRTDDEILSSLFEDDEGELGDSAEERRVVTRIRKRNENAVRGLKELYGHTCQITGTQFLFKKADGTYYTEAHHLVPLGEGGSDNPLNIIVVSPLVHRMLHYAKVSAIDLSKIKHHGDGTSYLDITINEDEFRIRWKSAHIARVQEKAEHP